MINNDLVYVRGSLFDEDKMIMCWFVNQNYQVPLNIVNSSFGSCSLWFVQAPYTDTIEITEWGITIYSKSINYLNTQI